MDFFGAQDTSLWYKSASEGSPFDKTACVKFKISNNFKQNSYETDSKHPKIHRKKIHTSLWILKISRKKSANKKSGDYCHLFVIFNKKIHG